MPERDALLSALYVLEAVVESDSFKRSLPRNYRIKLVFILSMIALIYP
ncbi:MAG UNVERIFIED_CONTAM: hypothetical protein LVR29_04595 [Microcystis novacekii LVE1205-3]